MNESEKWLSRASKVIPGACQTYSKGPAYGTDHTPVALRPARGGCKFLDIDGKEFIDWEMALGACILGYRHRHWPPVYDPIGGSLPYYPEVQLAEKICEIIPSADMVRFTKTGSLACAMAVKVARAFTGNEFIISIGYHGTCDLFTHDCKGSRHASQKTIKCEYNDPGHLEALINSFHGNIACIIMEPIALESPKPGYVEAVRELCNGLQTLLIFDEIVTGFRYKELSFQKAWGITPDLTVLGKALGNGVDVSCVCGRRDIMQTIADGTCFMSTTFAGDVQGMVAGIETIDELQKSHSLLWERGWTFTHELKNLIEPYSWLSLQGYPTRFRLACETDMQQATLQDLLAQKGYLSRNGAHNLCLAHTTEVWQTYIEVASRILKRIDAYTKISDMLHEIAPKKMPQPVFKREPR